MVSCEGADDARSPVVTYPDRLGDVELVSEVHKLAHKGFQRVIALVLRACGASIAAHVRGNDAVFRASGSGREVLELMLPNLSQVRPAMNEDQWKSIAGASFVVVGCLAIRVGNICCFERIHDGRDVVVDQGPGAA